MGSNLSWADIKEKTIIKSTRQGTTVCRQSVHLSTIDGIVDPVLEYMNQHDMIISEGDAWHIVKCPWHEKHTDGSQSAVYIPVGVGDHPQMRGFTCFHSHCKNIKTIDFLHWIAAAGGPGQALQQLGGQVTQLSTGLLAQQRDRQEKDNREEVARLSSELAIQNAVSRAEFEQDQDFDTKQDRFGKSLNDISAGIS